MWGFGSSQVMFAAAMELTYPVNPSLPLPVCCQTPL